MNKIYLIIFLLLVIVVSLYFAFPLWFKSQNVEDTTLPEPVETNLKPVGNDLLGAEFIIPGLETKVKLSADIVDFTDGENRGSVIYLIKNAVAVHLDNKDYLVAPIATNTGGSGTFVYLVLYEKKGNSFLQLDDEFIGDRIKVEKVINAENKIAVSIFDRKPDEPFSAVPTVPVTVVFEIIDNKLNKQ